MYGGDYAVCNVVAGNTYTWETCSSSAFDSELTISNATHTGYYAYDDDGCGSLSSRVTWVATITGPVHVLLSEIGCQTNVTCMVVRWSCSAPPVPCTVSTPTGTTVGSVAGSANIAVTSNGTSAWTATESCSWVTLSPAGGIGAGTIVANYLQNVTASTRSCVITVTCGSSSSTYTLTQTPFVCSACPAFDFNLNTTSSWGITSSSIPSSGCKIYRIPVDIGKEYTFKTGCGDNASADFDTELFLYDSICGFLASNDNGCSPDKSVISIISTSSDYVYLKVAGHGNNAGNFTLAFRHQDTPTCSVYVEDGKSVGPAAGSITVPVTSNGFSAWTATESSPWLSLAPTTGTGSDSTVITYQANSSSVSRSYTVNFSCGTSTDTYQIKQLGVGPNLIEASSNLIATGNVVDITVNVTNNGTNTAQATRIGYYLSFNTTISPASNYLIGSDSVPSLAVGDTIQTHRVIDLVTVANIPWGPLCLGYAIDYPNKVAESDENDNKVLLSNGCVVGVEESSLEPSNLTIYPNPTSGGFTVNMGKRIAEASVIVLDMTGQTVSQFSLRDQQKAQIVLEAAPGIYFVYVQWERERTVLKLFKD